MDFAASIMVKCSHDVSAYEVEKLDFILILKNSLFQITLIFNLLSIYQKVVTVFFQQIKHGHRRPEDSATVHQYTASNPGLNHVLEHHVNIYSIKYNLL
jgi:hypothetical protein